MQLVLTGGFLGAGKTTAIVQACKYLKTKGIKTAVIVNDQGNELVDKIFLTYEEVFTEEVTGGCFCCNFNDLSSILLRLQNTLQPDLVFAESVGSCTDLIATVLKPIKKLHPGINVTLSVLVDAGALFRQFKTRQYIFKSSVQYIFDKQLEEADIIVLTKPDLLIKNDRGQVSNLLKIKYPEKEILIQNNFSHDDIENWMNTVLKFESGDRMSLEIDYNTYGAGESELAWLDARVEIEGSSAGAVASLLAHSLRNYIESQFWPIGHLKFMLKTGSFETKISFTSNDADGGNLNLVPNGLAATLLVNARVQCTPEKLRIGLETIVNQIKNDHEVIVDIKGLQFFKPGFPVPTYRMV